jgi:hypothetical protein
MPVINKRKYGRLTVGGIDLGVIVGTNICCNVTNGSNNIELYLIVKDGNHIFEFGVTPFADIQHFCLKNLRNDFIIDWGENVVPEGRKLLCQ